MGDHRGGDDEFIKLHAEIKRLWRVNTALMAALDKVHQTTAEVALEAKRKASQ